MERGRQEGGDRPQVTTPVDRGQDGRGMVESISPDQQFASFLREGRFML